MIEGQETEQKKYTLNLPGEIASLPMASMEVSKLALDSNLTIRLTASGHTLEQSVIAIVEILLPKALAVLEKESLKDTAKNTKNEY